MLILLLKILILFMIGKAILIRLGILWFGTVLFLGVNRSTTFENSGHQVAYWSQVSIIISLIVLIARNEQLLKVPKRICL